MAPKTVYHVRAIHLTKTRTVQESSGGICFQNDLFMFYIVSTFLLHQAFHLPQGFQSFVLLYPRANFTQRTQSYLLWVGNLHDRTFCVRIDINV